MSAGSVTPVQNNGFSVFFIDGSQNTLVGGGSGQGLGIVSNTDTSSTSAVQGLFAALGFDVQGTFSKNASPFTSGLPSTTPNSLCLRITSDLNYVGSIILPSNILYPYTINNTLRIDVRNRFRNITVSKLYNTTYLPLTTFDCSTLTNLGKLPANGKVGIGFSGDTKFYVKDINLNYSI